jgi:hypothetical protein
VQTRPVYKIGLTFQAPFVAQMALRIDAKVVKFRRENRLSLWPVWLDLLSVNTKTEINLSSMGVGDTAIGTVKITDASGAKTYNVTVPK